MNLGEMTTEVSNLIQDDSYSNTIIKNYINNTIKYIADIVNLPGLKGIDSVDTVVSQNYANLTGLASGFSGRLVSCLSDSIIIYSTLEDLMANYAPDIDEAGNVEGIALEGNILWYQKIPAAAESLVFIYYQNPETLISDDDTPPADIPESVHRKLFVYGAAHFIYNEIEDGIDGEKVNTTAQFWQAFSSKNRHSGLSELKSILARKKVHYITSVWNY
jgi:hypothetical protein